MLSRACFQLATAFVFGEELSEEFLRFLAESIPGIGHLSVSLVGQEGGYLLYYPVLEPGPPERKVLTAIAKCREGTAAWECFQTRCLVQGYVEPDRSTNFADWAMVSQQYQMRDFVTCPMEVSSRLVGVLTVAAPFSLDGESVRNLSSVLGQCLAHAKCKHDLELSVGLLKNLYPANVVNFLVPDLKESSTPSVASRHGCDPLDTAALGGPLQLAAQGSMSAVPGGLKESKHAAAGSESESGEGALVPTFFSCSRCHQVNSVDVRPIQIAGSEKNGSAGGGSRMQSVDPKGTVVAWDLTFQDSILERRFAIWYTNQLGFMDAAHMMLLVAINLVAGARFWQLGSYGSSALGLSVLGLLCELVPLLMQVLVKEWYQSNREGVMSFFRLCSLAWLLLQHVFLPLSSAGSGRRALRLLCSSGACTLALSGLVHRIRFRAHLHCLLTGSVLSVACSALVLRGCGAVDQQAGSLIELALVSVLLLGCTGLPGVLLYASEERARKQFVHALDSPDSPLAHSRAVKKTV